MVGGWLRDKLFGLESDDIDISLDNISGLKFAKMVQDYMLEKGLAKSPSECKVTENPAQSEHLETATIMIFGLEIDLVKLRKETYNEQNRIPELSPGTPLDDALRRDLTINALFYELKGNKIEDLTGKGIEDLNKRVARTVIGAKESFSQDPLRILRIYRFASRYELTLDGDI